MTSFLPSLGFLFKNNITFYIYLRTRRSSTGNFIKNCTNILDLRNIYICSVTRITFIAELFKWLLHQMAEVFLFWYFCYVIFITFFHIVHTHYNIFYSYIIFSNIFSINIILIFFFVFVVSLNILQKFVQRDSFEYTLLWTDIINMPILNFNLLWEWIWNLTCMVFMLYHWCKFCMLLFRTNYVHTQQFVDPIIKRNNYIFLFQLVSRKFFCVLPFF